MSKRWAPGTPADAFLNWGYAFQVGVEENTCLPACLPAWYWAHCVFEFEIEFDEAFVPPRVLQAPTWKTANIDHVLLTKASGGVFVGGRVRGRTPGSGKGCTAGSGTDTYPPSPHPTCRNTPPSPNLPRRCSGRQTASLCASSTTSATAGTRSR